VQFRERLPCLAQQLAEHERCVNAIAGGMHAQIDDVPRLFAAQDSAALQHQLQDVLVSHLRTKELDAVLSQLLLEAEIRHHGGDHTILA
jgi:hypothetical protein